MRHPGTLRQRIAAGSAAALLLGLSACSSADAHATIGYTASASSAAPAAPSDSTTQGPSASGAATPSAQASTQSLPGAASSAPAEGQDDSSAKTTQSAAPSATPTADAPPPTPKPSETAEPSGTAEPTITKASASGWSPQAKYFLSHEVAKGLDAIASSGCTDDAAASLTRWSSECIEQLRQLDSLSTQMLSEVVISYEDFGDPPTPATVQAAQRARNLADKQAELVTQSTSYRCLDQGDPQRKIPRASDGQLTECRYFFTMHYWKQYKAQMQILADG